MSSDLHRIARALVLVELALERVEHIRTALLVDQRLKFTIDTLNVLLTDTLDELEIVNERATL